MNFYRAWVPDLPIKRGEDTELCFALRRLGARLYYDQNLTIKHFMPADRLTWPQALKLASMLGGAGPLLELYLMALEDPSFRLYPWWKKTWGFQTAKHLQKLASMMLLHPRDCFSPQEGSRFALKFRNTLAKFNTMLALYGRYNKTRDRIRLAAWAQDKPSNRTGS